MNKNTQLKKLCNDKGIITALAIDQRGVLKKMLGEEIKATQIEQFKLLVAQSLTPFASAILLDPEFGWLAASYKSPQCGLIMAYEKTGYDQNSQGRLPNLINEVSVRSLKDQGADGVKLLLYMDIDESESINQRKKIFVERVGSECQAESLPFFLEILTYDSQISDPKQFAKIKPRKVIEAMNLFSDPRFQVDVLKVEVPVDMNYVEGFSQEEILYSTAEASAYFKAQSESTSLPFIFLSAGVSPQLFQQSLLFAKQSGSTFNGVLCGRATWAEATNEFTTAGKQATIQWLNNIGLHHIKSLNDVLAHTATPIKFDNEEIK